MKLQLEKKELVQLSDDPQVLPLAMTDEVAGGKHKIHLKCCLPFARKQVIHHVTTVKSGSFC